MERRKKRITEVAWPGIESRTGSWKRRKKDEKKKMKGKGSIKRERSL